MSVRESTVPPVGREWVVDASGCDPAALRNPARLRALVSAMIEELGLHPVGDPVWHVFPGEGGVTGMVLLSESHLTLHTFPEHGTLALNLYSCRERPTWPFAEQLRARVGAETVQVRALARGRVTP